jgi:hypothetical protein
MTRDIGDTCGNRLHHLGIGVTYAHTPVLILLAAHTVTVISKTGHPAGGQGISKPMTRLTCNP